MSGKGREDNYGNLVANPLTDVLDVSGEKDFTPERLRFYANGSRRFLQYGSDPRYTETNVGHVLTPDAGDVLTLRSAQKIIYPVEFDLIPSVAWRIVEALESGDAVAGGYGDPDITNFDPATTSYSGSSADGFFWLVTAETFPDEVILAMVQDGTIVYRTTRTLAKDANVWSILSQWLNWYAVGPSRFFERYTDIAENDKRPQMNEPLGAVANDDGKGPIRGSHRVTMQVKRDSTSSSLPLEVGSFGVVIPGNFRYRYRTKTHPTDVAVNNTTDGIYEWVGGIKLADDKPGTALQLADITITVPPSSTTDATLIVQSVDPSSTSLVDGDFSTPPERSKTNSVLREATDTSTTGPIEGAAGSDVTGPATAQTTSNPGGYQLGFAEQQSVGSGSKTAIESFSNFSDRLLVDTDYALIGIDSNESGIFRLNITSRET